MVYTVLDSMTHLLQLSWTVDPMSFLLGAVLGAVLLVLLIVVIWLAVKL